MIGFRAAIDPVLLAAAVPAEPGEAVLEAGLGAGAAALSLLVRVPGTRVVGIERDPELARLAQDNAGLNGLETRLTVIIGDLADPTTHRAAAAHGPFRHAMANPPFHRGGTVSPEPGRRQAAHESDEAPLSLWAAVLGRRLAPRGSLTFVLPAARLPDALAGFAAAGLGSPAILPLWPRQGEPAKRILLQGTKAGRSLCRILPGLVLHDEGGRFTDRAERILRAAAPLPFR